MQLVEAMAPIIERVEKRDGGMAKQMKEATTSIASNLSEGSQRRGKDRSYLFSVAAGSASDYGVNRGLRFRKHLRSLRFQNAPLS